MNIKEIYNERYSSENIDNWSSSNKYQNQHLATLIKKRLIKEFNADISKCTLLDVGCGFGAQADAFREIAYQVTGIDISDVGINMARERYPSCSFETMDAYHPSFNGNFDIVFCKGFSGYNTHDPKVVANFINNYLPLIKENGFFILAHASNFEGEEKKDEMANWTKSELHNIVSLTKFKRFSKICYFFDFKKKWPAFLMKLYKDSFQKKHNFFIIFQK